MIKHAGMIVIAAVVVFSLLMSTVAFTVPSTEIVLVKTFGRTDEGRVYRGSDPAQAGLKFKWPYPIQEVVRYDARTAVVDEITTTFQTHDKTLLMAKTFCAWRIADPVRFDRQTTPELRLQHLLRDAKEKVLPQYFMRDFVNTDEGRMRLAEIAGQVQAMIARRALEDYGIEVVMVGFRELKLPEAVTEVVIDAMMKERQKEVNQYRASGEAQATAIRERARAAHQQILAFANAKAASIRAEGDSAAAAYYREFSQDTELAQFLRWLESSSRILKERTVIFLDPSVLPPLRWFSDRGEGPREFNMQSTVSDRQEQP